MQIVINRGKALDPVAKPYYGYNYKSLEHQIYNEDITSNSSGGQNGSNFASSESESEAERNRLLAEATKAAEKLMSAQFGKLNLESQLRTAETRYPTRIHSPRYYNEKKEIINRANKLLQNKGGFLSSFILNGSSWFKCADLLLSNCNDYNEAGITQDSSNMTFPLGDNPSQVFVGVKSKETSDNKNETDLSVSDIDSNTNNLNIDDQSYVKNSNYNTKQKCSNNTETKNGNVMKVEGTINETSDICYFENGSAFFTYLDSIGDGKKHLNNVKLSKEILDICKSNSSNIKKQSNIKNTTKDNIKDNTNYICDSSIRIDSGQYLELLGIDTLKLGSFGISNTDKNMKDKESSAFIKQPVKSEAFPKTKVKNLPKNKMSDDHKDNILSNNNNKNTESHLKIRKSNKSNICKQKDNLVENTVVTVSNSRQHLETRKDKGKICKNQIKTCKNLKECKTHESLESLSYSSNIINVTSNCIFTDIF
ncbi:uncharacterized protein CMU_025750 [Cryptosporidium muris RN66]|uniref:Uncharacterized protein n=1 Tax=Cryptosporidium muris (strain RN66) TaxID=441375 RepID=B6AB16_CRYMR|nr:uncharacterized protein CMU_025750 [Cryptosporidium muris RN66]EEA05568.1 hypothetical protein, conserved [Cryptosporidium muris RN66]|eukprot:XP_002139917.1 hypothetical protein [Cryptosporidium muris RN66]